MAEKRPDGGHTASPDDDHPPVDDGLASQTHRVDIRDYLIGDYELASWSDFGISLPPPRTAALNGSLNPPNGIAPDQPPTAGGDLNLPDGLAHHQTATTGRNLASLNDFGPDHEELDWSHFGISLAPPRTAALSGSLSLPTGFNPAYDFPDRSDSQSALASPSLPGRGHVFEAGPAQPQDYGDLAPLLGRRFFSPQSSENGLTCTPSPPPRNSRAETPVQGPTRFVFGTDRPHVEAPDGLADHSQEPSINRAPWENAIMRSAPLMPYAANDHIHGGIMEEYPGTASQKQGALDVVVGEDAEEQGGDAAHRGLPGDASDDEAEVGSQNSMVLETGQAAQAVPNISPSQPANPKTGPNEPVRNDKSQRITRGPGCTEFQSGSFRKRKRDGDDEDDPQREFKRAHFSPSH
ncbi:hypothetical protein QBC42DRAFT_320274 [Cladorrhinum samala]|uniref:Uncharacterized protein n=1 Tax=Cladorrhinum samala TaxID=585594 RepID=A0AAV9H8Y7_9PEZI|nr:hypothetical protein QBC42DRAFT_320274 [Cladorrhinum samala]